MYEEYLSKIENGIFESGGFSIELENMCGVLSDYVDDKKTVDKHVIVGALTYIRYLQSIVDKLDDR